MNDIREIIGKKVPATATHYQLSKIGGGDFVLFFKQNPREPEPAKMQKQVVLNGREMQMIEANLRGPNNPHGHFEYGWVVPLSQE